MRFHSWLLAATLFTLAPIAQAQLVTFIGTDFGVNSADPHPNAEAAAANFDAAASALGPVSLLTFENSPVGSLPCLLLRWVSPSPELGLPIWTSATCLLPLPMGCLDTTRPPGEPALFLLWWQRCLLLRPPCLGLRRLLSGVQFSSVNLMFDDGSAQTLPIPFDLGGGATSFVGFTNTGAFFSSITVNAGDDPILGGDIIGLDDVRFVVPGAAVPEPGSTALLLVLVSIAGLLLRRRRVK